jgi:hypothetical protein
MGIAPRFRFRDVRLRYRPGKLVLESEETDMQTGRLVIFALAVLITAGEAMAILHATASIDSRHDTSETPIFARGAKLNPPDVALLPPNVGE